jgi:uncharacterized protein YkwD
MHRTSGMSSTSVSLALLLAGCEGVLSAGDPVTQRDGGPSRQGDAGEETSDRDASTRRDAGPSGRDDAGPPPRVDAGPPPDPCEGLDLRGECAGNVARWCEGGSVREDDCTASGEICGDAGGNRRCVIPDPGCGNEVEQEQLRLTNVERAREGLDALECDPGLTIAARLHSQDMCDNDYFSHTSLDGRTFGMRITAQGVRWRTAGENIAWGQGSAEEVTQAWMESPGHRANIMNGDFGRLGVGYVECVDGSGRARPYWTQDFTD